MVRRTGRYVTAAPLTLIPHQDFHIQDIASGQLRTVQCSGDVVHIRICTGDQSAHTGIHEIGNDGCQNPDDRHYD